MSLLYSDVEEELRAAVRSLLADACPPSAVLGRVESAEPYDLGLWKSLARDIGVAGLLIPEEHGGAGATPREAAVVMEELGRAVAPVPFLSSAVLATRALLDAGASAPLERLASGETTACLVVPFAASPYADVPVVSHDGGALTGTVRGVVGAEVADLLVVPVDEGLAVVEASAAEIVPAVSLDQTRPIATVTFNDAAYEVVGGFSPDVLRAGAGLLASEQLGIAEWCLTTTVAYVKERRQFARQIGSFQAIKHRLADLWLEVVGARAAARNAVSLEPQAVAVAAAYCGPVAVHAAEEALQLHGGIGMTWEHPVHLYLKRAKADEIALGTPGDHRAALASIADLPA
ncbi:acyl-CoA/acyl-ACP dehydrogenase [Streptosporangiaceae bacterium NEAU-GS5]|nr:acyl-CoA/acyl-ACP dehydrogenase [Streptosporangiaceae bacterium NEAU-GS5]